MSDYQKDNNNLYVYQKLSGAGKPFLSFDLEDLKTIVQDAGFHTQLRNGNMVVFAQVYDAPTGKNYTHSINFRSSNYQKGGMPQSQATQQKAAPVAADDESLPF